MEADAEFLDATLPALDLLHNLARRFVSDPRDAEDLVQETYLRAWQAWPGRQRPDRVDAWLATICLNAGRDLVRRRAGRPEVLRAQLADVHADVDVAGAATTQVLRAQLEAALWDLPEPQRVAIVLMDLCGLSAAEVAGVTGSPRGTVLARVHRGRKALAALVAEKEGSRRAARS